MIYEVAYADVSANDNSNIQELSKGWFIMKLMAALADNQSKCLSLQLALYDDPSHF